MEGQGKQREELTGSLLAFLRDIPLLIIAAFILAWLLKTFIVQMFWIPSPSMEPTLYTGDRIFVNKFIYRFQDPRPGDTVVFISPFDSSKDFIKRVIATKGETIEIKSGRVFIDGKELIEPYVKQGDLSNYGPVKVPSDHVFLMGDNRPNSYDSRFFGPLPRKSVIGKAFMIYWPPNRIELLR
ncbi:MAG: signal peptidase I [Actinomycetota bacterium]|nr:signal peptidase I [Actinomycetota bacterium]